MLNNSLADEERDFITPLVLIGGALVLILLVVGLFLPTINWANW